MIKKRKYSGEWNKRRDKDERKGKGEGRMEGCKEEKGGDWTELDFQAESEHRAREHMI